MTKNFRSFIISDVLFTNISHFGSLKFLRVTFLWTWPQLIHCPCLILKERFRSFFRPIFEIFALLRMWKSTNTCQTLIQKMDVPVMSFQLTPICLFLQDFRCKEREMNKYQVRANNWPFLTVGTKWLDSLMASENACLQQDKKKPCTSRFPIHILLSVRKCS